MQIQTDLKSFLIKKSLKFHKTFASLCQEVFFMLTLSVLQNQNP